MQLWVAIKLASREMRSARRALAFCVLSVAIGVAALTSIRSVTNSLRRSLVAEGQQLSGADLSISGLKPLDAPLVAALTSDLVKQGARHVDSVTFNSMLIRTGESAARKHTTMVHVRAVGDAFPFYGSIQTEPPGNFGQLGNAPTVIVDPSVLKALGITAGASVKLGNLNATVLASFVKQAGGPAAAFSFVPTIFLHERYVSQTGLLQTGSRVGYERLFALPQGVSAARIKEVYWDQVVAAKLELRTYEESAAGVQRFVERLSTFLTIIGLVVLLLGALGIGSALHALMKQKLDHAAILRCLGATPRGIFAIYSLLSLFIATLGSLIGAGVGSAIPLALNGVLQRWGSEYLPTHLVLRADAGAMLSSVVVGVAATFAFTLSPLWRTATVAPLRVLRRETEPGSGSHTAGRFSRARAPLSVALLAGSIVFSIAAFETRAPVTAAWFTLVVAGVLVLLTALARFAAWVALQAGPVLRGYTMRQGIANLHRPGNQTQSTIVAVGLGVMLLSMIAILQRSMNQSLALESRTELPNLFVIDVLPQQFTGVSALLERHGAVAVDLQPMITGRIHSLNGKPIDISQVERQAGKRSWQDQLRTREYFFTYREHTLPSETITAGTFWSGRPSTQEASVDDQLAQTLGITLGDTLTLDIQGLPIEARVTSVRQIRWQAMRPNSLVVLSPGAIEEAPKTFVGSLRMNSESARFEVQTALVDAFPNLSVVDVTEAAETAAGLLSRVSQMFSLVGLMAIAIGSVIVAGAIAAGRFTRQRETMLLKVLGANPRQLGQILTAEYAALAVLGAGAGWLLAELVSRGALPLLFQVQATVPYATVALIVSSTIALNVLVAAWAGRQVSMTPALEILRDQ